MIRTGKVGALGLALLLSVDILAGSGFANEGMVAVDNTSSIGGRKPQRKHSHITNRYMLLYFILDTRPGTPSRS